MVTMGIANLKLCQPCFEVYFRQRHIPKKYEEGSTDDFIILDILVGSSFYRRLPAKL